MDIKMVGTILILVSDNFFQKKLAKNLKAEGYRIRLARDTRQALDKVKSADLNLILIDEGFLVENSPGADFILNLKDACPTASMVMMVTPETEKKSLIHELLSSGNIEHCIFKPFLFQSLTSLILNIITKNLKKSGRKGGVLSENFPAAERRKFIRARVPVEVYYLFIDKSRQTPSVIEQKAKPNDISAEGMCLDIDAKVNIPKFLELKILLPSEKHMNVTGQVIWERKNPSKNTKSVGLNFVDIKPHCSKIVSNHIMMAQ